MVHPNGGPSGPTHVDRPDDGTSGPADVHRGGTSTTLEEDEDSPQPLEEDLFSGLGECMVLKRSTLNQPPDGPIMRFKERSEWSDFRVQWTRGPGLS